MSKNEYTVYILKCSDETLYTGITTDLEKRVEAHNDGIASKYTRVRTPVEVMYTEEAVNRSDASKRERKIKQLTRQEKEQLIQLNENL